MRDWKVILFVFVIPLHSQIPQQAFIDLSYTSLTISASLLQFRCTDVLWVCQGTCSLHRMQRAVFSCVTVGC